MFHHDLHNQKVAKLVRAAASLDVANQPGHNHSHPGHMMVLMFMPSRLTNSIKFAIEVPPLPCIAGWVGFNHASLVCQLHRDAWSCPIHGIQLDWTSSNWISCKVAPRITIHGMDANAAVGHSQIQE